MNAKRTGAMLMAAVLLVSAVAPAAVTAQTASLALDVTQDSETGTVTVTVTEDGTAVENATVDVTTGENDSYAGTGAYETNGNGTVTLPAPEESTTVTVAAADDGAIATTTTDLEPSIDVTVEGADDGTVEVTVTRGGSAVENATVNVTANATYADAGEHSTDENGTVTLANPDEPVELSITATDDGETATTTVVIRPVETLAVSVGQVADGSVTVSVGRLGEPVANASVEVTVDGNGTYVGAGEHSTDENGTVALPAPSEAVTVTVEASEDGETATTTADLTPPESTGPFGQVVSAFVSTLQIAGFDGPLGQQVSEFVTGNNPSNENANASERGPPAHAGPGGANEPDDDGENDSRVVPAGPPVDAPERAGDGNESDGAPGNSGDAPGNSGDAPGNSGDAPGNSGDAPGNSGDGDEEDDAEEEGEPTETASGDDADSDDAGGNGNGNAGGNGNGNAGGNGNGNGR